MLSTSHFTLSPISTAPYTRSSCAAMADPCRRRVFRISSSFRATWPKVMGTTVVERMTAFSTSLCGSRFLRSGSSRSRGEKSLTTAPTEPSSTVCTRPRAPSWSRPMAPKSASSSARMSPYR